MRRLFLNYLVILSSKITKRQLLFFSHNEKKGLQRSKQLLNRIGAVTLQNMIFTDEKLFTIKRSFNHQNDRVQQFLILCISVNSLFILLNAFLHSQSMVFSATLCRTTCLQFHRDSSPIRKLSSVHCHIGVLVEHCNS